MASEEKFIRREKGAGVRSPKRIKTEKSGPDAGTNSETAASEVSGKADLLESQIHKALSFLSLPLSAASDVTLRRSLRKYGDLSSAQLVFLDALDCFEDFKYDATLMDLYVKAAFDPRASPALAQSCRERAHRLCGKYKSNVQQLTSDINVVAAAQQSKPIQPGWKRGKLVLKQTPNGKTPALFYFGKTEKREGTRYTVPSGDAWDTVCAMIRANAFDSHGLELKKSPSDQFKRGHRTFFSQRMGHDGKFWFIKTQ
jgi:hypothetical protein